MGIAATLARICGGKEKLAPSGPPEATGEGSLHSPQALETPRRKDSRRSSIFLPFLPSFIARGDSTHTSGPNTPCVIEESRDNVDGMVLIVPPSTNLAQLQAMLDIAEEGTMLDLQNATIQMDGTELAGGCLRIARSIRLFNGALRLPPRCSIEIVTPDCAVTLSEVSIAFHPRSAKVPALVVRKGAHLHLNDCCVEGGFEGDAVHISGTGSSMRARSCEIRSSGKGAAVTVSLGGHATVVDCSVQGLVGLEATNTGSKVYARQCTMDGSTGSVEGTGVAISDGATGDLQGCTMYMEKCRGLHVSGRGTNVTAKNCVMSKCGWSNVGVYDSASLVLQDCTCNSSITGSGLEVEGKGTRLHAVNTVANFNKEFNVSVASGANAHLVDCTLNSARAYGLHVTDRGTAHVVGCILSDSGMHNVVVSGGAAASLQKCRTYGSRARGYTAFGNTSRLDVTDCLWSPNPPPQMLQGATRHHNVPGLPEWLR